MFFLEKKTKLNPNTWGGCEYLSRCCRDLPWQIFANFPGAEPGWPLPVFLGFGGNLRAFDSRILPSALTLSPFFSPSFQHVHRWQLRYSWQQRCPAKPPVLLATSHGGDPQPHRGRCLLQLCYFWRISLFLDVFLLLVGLAVHTQRGGPKS